MKKASSFIRVRKSFFVLIMFIIAFAIATPVLADYLGPDRVTTETRVETYDYGVWARPVKFPGECTKPNGSPADACIICDWERKPGKACGDATHHYKLGTQSEVVTVTVALPPATISGTLQNCTLQNGWCVTLPQLSLNSHESLAGQSIITVEGTLNGNVFACVASTCTVSLGEGNNNFTYWAISSYGDSSTMGTFSQKVDTVSPDVALDVSGSNGTNGWYVSQTTVTATGADATSGLAEAVVSVDNSTWQPSTTLSDGVYNIAVRTTDNAGNISNSSNTISVDTITPTLNVSINGKLGKSNWYVSKVKVSATASDATSGVDFFEANIDNTGYKSYTAPIVLSDGYHSYQFRVRDKAGNVTESPLQNIRIDATFPAIFLTEESLLGETFSYDVQDDGSKLAAIRVVIEDEDEHFPKVAWEEPVSGEKFKDEILWDGKFNDNSQAPPGTYYITIKATDSAGNESISYGVVKVELFSFLQPIPEFTLPSNSTVYTDSDLSVSQDLADSTTVSVDLGGTVSQSTAITSQSFLLSTGTSSQPTPTSNTESNTLWGIVAIAAAGAATSYALEQKRKRKEEEERQLRAAEKQAKKLNAAEEARKAQQWQDGQDALNALIENAVIHGASEKEITALREQASTQGLEVAINNAEDLNEVLVNRQQAHNNFRAQELGYAIALEEHQAAIELQEGLMAYYLGTKAGEAAAAVQEPTWVDKAWDWAFQHQVELSLGTGIAVGLAAIAVTLFTTITAPIWLVVAGAVLLTALIVTAGTVTLNDHFGLDLGNNLATNLLVGTSATLVTAGVGLYLTSIAPFIGTTITNKCMENPALCSQAGIIIDNGEQALLSGQLAYYTWIGDQDNAALAAIDLQLEQMDGGVPGNVVARELGEQLAELGDEAMDLVEIYGDEIVPLLVKYGDEAVDVISTHGDEGISLLRRFGPDTSQAISIVESYGTPAVKLLEVTDPTSAHNLLKTLDDDVLDYVIKQGPEAVNALSGWSTKELMGFGPELALRAQKDAKVLSAIDELIKLKPIDPKNLTDEQQALIKTIAENSMQYTDGGQIVLGKWVDYGNGFTYVARETGSIHYNPHPEMWNLLEVLDNREEVAWLVNKEVIQIGINKGLPFEYTLDGIPSDDIFKEKGAIDLIFSGASDIEIKNVLEVDRIAIRWQELRELQKAGYEFSFDEINSSFIFSLP